MKHRQVIATLSGDIDAIQAGLVAALAHLGDWTGEYPGSASGAPPATASGYSAGDQPAANEAPLNRFELLATSGDHATAMRLSLLGWLRWSSHDARKLFADLDGVGLPVDAITDSHDLAVLRWALRRLNIEGDRVNAKLLARLARSVETTRRLVDQAQPPQRQAPTGCRLHATNGDHVEVARDFQALGLCRRCGDFRRTHHGADPTQAIIRAWGKGQRPTADQVTDAERAAKAKRKRRKKVA